MIASLDGSDGAFWSANWRERLASGAVIASWLLLAGLIAASYVGHATSPYGVCYGATTRSVPCAALVRR